MLTGMHLVPAGPCQLAGAVSADDVLRGDLDCRDVRADGLYLVEAVGADGGDWMGCRRFDVSALGAVTVEYGGAWCEVPAGLRVAGRVAQVIGRCIERIACRVNDCRERGYWTDYDARMLVARGAPWPIEEGSYEG